jgi:endonuclease YncB( thermonuclease family)
MRPFILSLIFILSTTLSALAKEPIRSIEGTVIKVSDGDTIQVVDSLGTKVKVRFYGIDCPETEKSNHKTGRVSKAGQPYGEDAYRALQGKLQRQHVRLDVMDTQT